MFQAQTATGKLKAVMTPTTPSGCQVSISRWPGRSEAIVSPRLPGQTKRTRRCRYLLDLAAGLGADLPGLDRDQIGQGAALCSRSSSPNRRTTWPRTGAGTAGATASYAVAARATAAATSVGRGPGEGRDRQAVDRRQSRRASPADGGQVHAARGGGRPRRASGGRTRRGGSYERR